MRMLAENPLFKQNPGCFGDLMKKLAGAGANEILEQALLGQGVAKQATPQRAVNRKGLLSSVEEVGGSIVESRPTPTPESQTQVEPMPSSTLESTQVETQVEPTIPETLQTHSPEPVLRELVAATSTAEGRPNGETLDQKVERVVRTQLMKHDEGQIRMKCMAAQHDPLLPVYLSDVHGLVDEEIMEYEFGITEEFEELVHFTTWKEVQALRESQAQLVPSPHSEAAPEILEPKSATAPVPHEEITPTADEMMQDLQEELEKLDLVELRTDKAAGTLDNAGEHLGLRGCGSAAGREKVAACGKLP